MPTNSSINYVIEHAQTPIDSLNLSLAGNASANISFDFKTKVVLATNFKQILSSSPTQANVDAINDILGVMAGLSTIQHPTNGSIPAVQQKKVITVSANDNFLQQQIFQVQKSSVTIKGSVNLVNNSAIPITAKVFVETLVVTNSNGDSMNIVDPSNPILGHSTGTGSRGLDSGNISIVPISTNSLTLAVD